MTAVPFGCILRRMELLITLALVLGLVTGFIAQSKGYSFVLWWIGGTLLWIVALPEVLLKKPNRAGQRQCPACMSWVPQQATACAHCGRDVVVPA